MFVKFGHITICIFDNNTLVNIVKFLEKLNYKLLFKKNRLNNHTEKRKFTKFCNYKYNMLYLVKKNQPSIELLQYKNLKRNDFDHSHNKIITSKSIPSNLKNIFENIKSFKTNFSKKDGKKIKNFSAIYYVNNLNTSLSFFKRINFNVIYKLKNTAILQFKNHFVGRINILIMQIKKIENRLSLDSFGVSAIAIYTNNILTDNMILKKKGIKSSKIFQVKINNKKFKVSFIFGPNNEKIELLQAI